METRSPKKVSNFDRNSEASQDDDRFELKSRFMVFRLREKRYCVPLLCIREVVINISITPMPGLPSFFMGLLNLRGKIISIMDLGKKLGAPDIEIESKRACIIIFQVEEIVLGAMVDEVLAVSQYSKKDVLEESSLLSDTEYREITGVIKDELGGLTLLIDVEKSLNIEEIKKLKERVVA